MNNYTANLFSFKNNAIKHLGILLCLFSLAFTSCKQQQKITLNNGKCILDFKNAKVLTNHLKTNEFKFDRLNGKLNVDADIDSTSNSFNITLRMKRDSVIWLSISKLGIEGARVFITQDSVKLINRLKNNFFVGDFAYISKLLNTELDFEILQSLLIGNSVSFYDEDEKLKPGADDCLYTLGTIRKKKLRKAIEKGKDLKEPAQSIYMTPQTFKIARILFFEFNPNRSLDAHFGNHEKVDSTQFFPMKASYLIKAQKEVKIDVLYTKLILNEEQTFPFKIPDGYERIAIKEKK